MATSKLKKQKENALTSRAKEVDAKEVGGGAELRSRLQTEYKVAQDGIKYFSLSWDEYEDLVAVKSRTADNAHRRLSDGTLSSIVIERAGRNASRIPIGTVTSDSIANVGQGQLMDLVLHKYILPNANEQYDFPTKSFMWDMNSNIYGTAFMQYDWSVRNDYVGPDCWLLPQRNVFPQQGRFSVQNSDFVFVSTFVSVDFLQGLVDNNDESWDLDAIQQVLSKVRNKKGKQIALVPTARMDYLRKNPEFEFRRRAAWSDTGQIELVTKYEGSLYTSDPGRWIGFLPDFENIVIRNIDSPHKSGRIPIIDKSSIPTLESIIGFGDAERGALLQYAVDTTLNLQVDAQKLRTYPPVKVVNGNVVMSTLRFMPGAKWLLTTQNDVMHHQFPEVDTSINQIYQYLKGALNNVAGNTTTEISAENTDTLQGKTPAAIKAQQASQSTRDAIDVMFMDQAMEKLINGMLDLVAKIPHQNSIELYGYGQEIVQIAKDYPDILDYVKFVGKNRGQNPTQAPAVKIEIKPHDLINEKGYRYKIMPGSTKMQDQENQMAIASNLLKDFMPNAVVINQLMEMSGKTIDFGSLIETVFDNAQLDNIKQIIRPMAQGSAPQQMGASNTGNQNTGVKPPNELIDYKDISGTPAGNAMLSQAQLPPVGAQPGQPQAPQAPTVAVPGTAPAPANPGFGIPELNQAIASIRAREADFHSNIGGGNGQPV